MQSLKNKLGEFWLGVLLILIISAIAYLPLVKDLGYLNDDWYLMYDMQVKDPSFFHEIFAIDRPGRAYAMIPLFSLFGFNVLPYHITAFLFRFLGGVCLFWTMRMLWEKRNFFALAVGLLFTIYPGFLSQPNAIDYQSHILGLFLALLSIALTVKSILTNESTNRILLILASALTGWGYLSQMEYFIGIEVFRFACIFVLAWRTQHEKLRTKLINFVKTSLPFLLIAGGFLIWRLFFFESERQATDIGLQISQAISNPITSLWWLNYLIQDFFTVTLVAWNLPMYQLAFPMRLKDMMNASALALLAIAILWFIMRWGRENESEAETSNKSEVRRETLIMALLSIAGGLIPVILVNRHVTLPDYSRYSLIASVGAVMLLVLLFENISQRHIQKTVLSLFVAIAILTHYGNAMRYVNETAATRNFWWQVSWRAPMIKEGVTLIASYPQSGLSEDYFIWGPANFIYYPEKQNANPVEIKLPAAVITRDVINQITTNGGTETPLRRGNYLERDFGNVLVIIQSSSNGCVRFINGDAPELSPNDADRLILIAPHSKLENVLVAETESPPVPSYVFSKEPERGWCYYYQKADLARQRGKWEQIPILLKEALDKGYYPEDALEWMPFLQAYAVQGNVEKMRSTLKLVALNKQLSLQTCAIMRNFIEQETLNQEVIDFIQKKVCE
jgi:hypothetical protein